MRVRAHLLKISGYGIRGCSKVTPHDTSEFKRVVEEAAQRVESSKPSRVPLPLPTKTLGGMTYSQTQGWVDPKK